MDLPHGGEATLDLNGAQGVFTTRWTKPRSGTFGEEHRLTGGSNRKLSVPDTNDWALQLRQNQPGR